MLLPLAGLLFGSKGFNLLAISHIRQLINCPPVNDSHLPVISQMAPNCQESLAIYCESNRKEHGSVVLSVYFKWFYSACKQDPCCTNEAFL